MRPWMKGALGLAVLAGALGWWLTRPVGIDLSNFDGPKVIDRPADAKAGRLLFLASGCASCHVAPGQKAGEEPVLAGGLAFPSDFGTFYAPNISTDPENGIGDWTFAQFANAVIQGVSPEGKHYYPVFPYTAYAGMTHRDLTDLFAYLQTLPASSKPNSPHEVGFPFNIRLGIGLWKRRYVPSTTPAPDNRGAYLVETLAHCAECHTPRDAFGGLDRTRWMQGAPNPSGKGRIPGITPAQLDWSEADIVEYLTSGFTPDYDSAGGEMVHVIENLAQLPASDREAIAAYLVSLPAP